MHWSGDTCGSGPSSSSGPSATVSSRHSRTVGNPGALLTPLREDLDTWRAAGNAFPTAPVFPASSGTFWRATDWRNWRKRIYKPVAEAVGIDGARPYHLRHAFASLLIHEGRMSVVEIAAQLGHNPTVCLDTYAHVMAEQAGGERVSAERQIALARAAAASADGHAQLSFAGFDVLRVSAAGSCFDVITTGS